MDPQIILYRKENGSEKEMDDRKGVPSLSMTVWY
jgi:hypothetical protein